MRVIGILLLLLVVTFKVAAFCIGNGIHPLSQKAEIGKNGWFVLNFYGYSRKAIPKLNKSRPIYLQCGNEKISLKVVEVLHGKFNISQVVFISVSELKEHHRYDLHIDNLTRKEGEHYISHKDTSGVESFSISFLVHSLIDTGSPNKKFSIKQGRKIYTRYGCGPASYVVFTVHPSDSLFTVAKVGIRKIGRKKVRQFYLSINQQEIFVGHGMCSGPFRFRSNSRYEISVSRVDAFGIVSDSSKNLVFDSPLRTRL